MTAKEEKETSFFFPCVQTFFCLSSPLDKCLNFCVCVCEGCLINGWDAAAVWWAFWKTLFRVPQYFVGNEKKKFCQLSFLSRFIFSPVRLCCLSCNLRPIMYTRVTLCFSPSLSLSFSLSLLSLSPLSPLSLLAASKRQKNLFQ